MPTRMTGSQLPLQPIVAAINVSYLGGNPPLSNFEKIRRPFFLLKKPSCWPSANTRNICM